MKIRILSYNVLAQCLAKSSYFTYCKGDTLKWKARFPRLCAILKNANADIIALSEVDQSAAYSEWLIANKYRFVYQQRKGKQYGNLIAWKADKFDCIQAAACDMNDLAAAVRHSCPGVDVWRFPESNSELAAMVPFRPTAAAGESAKTDTPLATTAPPTPTTNTTSSSLPTTEEAAEKTPDAAPSYLTGEWMDFERHCAGVFVALRSRNTTSTTTTALSTTTTDDTPLSFIVACSHLFWEPTSHHVRHAQAALLQVCAVDFAQSLGGEEWPLLYAGDFNAMPATSAYATMRAHPIMPGEQMQFTTKGRPVSWDALARFSGPITTTVEEPLVNKAWLDFLALTIAKIYHKMSEKPTGTHSNLLSAYAEANREGKSGAGVTVLDYIKAELPHDAHFEPLFTTCTDGFRAAIDYIFFSQRAGRHTIKVESVAPMPTVEEIALEPSNAMPSSRHPSDHCCLVADIDVV